MTMEVTEGTVVETVVRKKEERGFTLTEIAIVLGIIGLILGAIWVAAAAVYTNLRSSKTQTELLNIVQNVRSMYGTSATVDTTGAADMTLASPQTKLTYIQAGVFPADMLNATAATANTVLDPFNGNVAISEYQNLTAGDSFTVTFDKVPTNACITLLTSITGNGRDPGLLGVTTAAVGTMPPTTGGTLTFPPVQASVAQTACNTPAGAAASGVAVAFYFKLK